MERKTKVRAGDGQQDILITREFDLPVDLLFKAHVEPEIFEEWMTHEYGTTKVLKLETQQHGGFAFQTTDAQGTVLFKANGVIHEFVPDQKITRTFEMENSPFEVQLEFLEFIKLTDDTSKLSMQIVFRTPELRDQLLKLPFEYGLSMAHNRLEEVLKKLK
jgi:uncharacterized protein YndB with AHSA1/START domain